MACPTNERSRDYDYAQRQTVRHDIHSLVELSGCLGCGLPCVLESIYGTQRWHQFLGKEKGALVAWQACQSEVLQGRRRLNYYFIYNLFFWSIQLFSHKSQLNNCLIFTFASCIIFGNYPQFSPLTQQFGGRRGLGLRMESMWHFHENCIHSTLPPSISWCAQSK